jgi:predicted nucleic acid-binding protein
MRSSDAFEMPAELRRVYIDANVLLAYVGNEEGRADTVQTVLDDARRGTLEILTSVLSIAEVAYGAHERDQGLSEAGEEAIEQLWTPASPITLVDVSQAVTRNARTMIRKAKSQDLGVFAAPMQSTSQRLECSAATRSSPTRARRAGNGGNRSLKSPCRSP